MSTPVTLTSKVCKVDKELGIVFGYAAICSEDGEEYFDLQDDAIVEKALLEAAVDFSENSRALKVMHEGEPRGSIVLIWPMTSDVAKAFDLDIDRSGLMIAAKPDAVTLEKFHSGELKGFSIAGTCDRVEVEDAA